MLSGYGNRMFGDGCGANGDTHALIRQLLHHLVEAAAFFAAEKISSGHADIVEEQLASVLTVHANFFECAADTITLQILGLYHNQRYAFGAYARRTGLDSQHDQIGVPAVGNKSFRSVYNQAFALPLSHGLNVLQVRSGNRLSHSDGTDQFALGHSWEPELFLLFGAVIENVVRRNAVDAMAKMHTGVAQLFGDHRFVTIVATTTAINLRNVGQQNADFSGFGPGFGVDAVLFAPARFVRNELLIYEALDSLAEELDILINPRRDVGVGNLWRPRHEIHCTRVRTGRRRAIGTRSFVT